MNMKSQRVIGLLCAGIFLIGYISAANAALVGRLETFPGSGVFQAYYDDQLDMTWAEASNLGPNTWGALTSAADNTLIGEIGGWRLPSMDVNNDGVIADCRVESKIACADNEYGHFYWYGAGPTFGGGITPFNPGPFSRVFSGSYFSSTEDVTDPTNNAWILFFSSSSTNSGSGTNISFNKLSLDNGWAVHSGDVGAVPVPAAIWLFGSGLLGLLGIAKRKKA